MRLAQGTTKNRLVVMGQGDWRSVYLGSSNLSLVEAFLAAGLLFDDAYRVRFPDIRGDAGHGYGAFENIHGRADAGTFAKELQARACTYFGAASEAYLERLAKDRHNRRDWLVTGLRRTMARYRALVSAGSAADGRITDLFAVIYAAAMLARHYGILLWTPEQIAWAVLTCQRAHHQSVAESQTKFDPIAAVQSYIAEHLSSFRKVPDPSITRQEFERGAGFIYTDRYGATEYLVPPAVFSREFAALNSHRVMRALVTSNLLVRTGDKHVSKAPIRSSTTDGREYVYRVRGRILTLVQK
jgi:putative DNA primase/helicase